MASGVLKLKDPSVQGKRQRIYCFELQRAGASSLTIVGLEKEKCDGQ